MKIPHFELNSRKVRKSESSPAPNQVGGYPVYQDLASCLNAGETTVSSIRSEDRRASAADRERAEELAHRAM